MKRKTRKKKMGKGRRKGKISIPHPLKKPSEMEEKLHKRRWRGLALFREEESFFIERENDS
jgi:hypothetical protein